MKWITLSAILAFLSTPALADHNSKWGEGWANMPNDIHNTRIDTRGDNTAFRDFVRQGNGAATDNGKSTRSAPASQQRIRSMETRQSVNRQSRGGGRR
jgi:hypothetical protein